MKRRSPEIYPSLICSDMYNLERSIYEFTSAGCTMIHVDVLDGHFSPSMPLGLDTIAQIRKHSDIQMDVHIMSDKNEFFIRKMIEMGCERICFHVETAPHVDYLLNLIRRSGIKAGLALKPSTPVWMLEEMAGCLDFVLLMLINPGYAGDGAETQVRYAADKVRQCRQFLEQKHCEIPIEVDGRITFDNLPVLLEAGAEQFVGGTGTYFQKNQTFAENKKQLDNILKRWEEGWHG